jgi:hypothetical protein
MSWVKKSFRIQMNVQMAVVIRAGLVSGRIITRKGAERAVRRVREAAR